MSLAKRVGWALPVVLLPLLLMGWALLQGWRADQPLEKAQIMRQWIAKPDDALLARLSRRELNEVIRDQDRRIDFQRQIDQVEAHQVGLHLRQVLASLAYWLAVASLLLALGTWLHIRVGAWRARLSQAYLEQRLAHGWRLLGQCLSAYMGLLVGALGFALLYELSWGWSHFKDGGLTVLILMLPMASMMGVGVAMIRRLRQQWIAWQSPPSGFPGRTLSPAQAPALWAWVHTLAEQVGAPVPDHLVVGLDQSFFVTSVRVGLQPSGQVLEGRTLYLPLASLCALSQEETAAIIGHELGHFRSQDTERCGELSARFRLMYGHYCSLADAAVPPRWLERPALWMAGDFLQQFERAVQHWSRAQELLADRVGAQVAGAPVFVRALLRVIALDQALQRLLRGHVGDNLIPAWHHYLRLHPLALDETQLQTAVAHPFDSHPPTRLRARQLDVQLDDELITAATRTPTDTDRRWFEQLLGLPASDTPTPGQGHPR